MKLRIATKMPCEDPEGCVHFLNECDLVNALAAKDKEIAGLREALGSLFPILDELNRDSSRNGYTHDTITIAKARTVLGETNERN